MAKGYFSQELEKNPRKESLRELQNTPRDLFALTTNIMRTPELVEIDDLQKVVSKELSLGVIKDDYFIDYINREMHMVIIPLFQIFKETRDKGVYNLLAWLLSSLIAEIKATRSKNGIGLGLAHGRGMKEMDNEVAKMQGYSLTNQPQGKDGGQIYD